MRAFLAFITSSILCTLAYAAEPVETQMPEGGSTSEITARESAATAVVNAQEALADLLQKNPAGGDESKKNEPETAPITGNYTHVENGRLVTTTTTGLMDLNTGRSTTIQMIQETTDAQGAPVITTTTWNQTGGYTKTIVTSTSITIALFDKDHNLEILPRGEPNPKIIPRETPKPKPLPGPSS